MIISQQHARALRGAGVGNGGSGHGAIYRRRWKSPILSKLTVLARTLVALFQHSMLEGILHQLGAGLQAEVFHNRVFVEGHGARGQMEEVRDFLHRAAFREELQHFALTLGELFHARLYGLAKEDTEGHALGDQRRDVGLARERLLDGGEQLSRRGALQQIARRAQPDRFRRNVGIFIHREEDQAHVRHFSAKLRASVHAVEPWHRDVEHDHIGPGTGGEIDEYAAIAGGADDFAPWLQQTPESVQKHRVVVGEEDAGAAIHWGICLFERGIDFMRDYRAAAIGTRASTVVPLPACDSTESSPCTNRARSPMLTSPSEPLARIVLGSKPTPSSAMASRSSLPSIASSTLATVPPLCLTTLCSASCAMR